MRAVQLAAAGPASNLKLVDLPIPIPEEGQVLIKVKSFGLNRSEIITRQSGRSPIGPVQLPLVLGIEATGVIESAPGSELEFPKGAVAMTAVGGMGVFFNGGYAQYTCVPKANVQVLKRTTKLSWDVLGALPEMLQTAHGALNRSLHLQAGDSLLIRGGTTSVGLSAAAIAKKAGATVLATTRRTDPKTAELMRANGVDHVIVEKGAETSRAVLQLFPGGVNKVLELVGARTMTDSLACLAPGGICCICGIVGGSLVVPDFDPLKMMIGKHLTAYGERSFIASNLPLDSLVEQIENGSLNVRVARVFQMDDIVSAHECLENNEALGKIVILTGM